MIQFVGNDGVFRAEQRFEQAAVGVEAGGVKNRVFCAEEFGQCRLQLLVDVLCAADEADPGHAEAVSVERSFRRSEDGRMISQSEVIVRAKIDHAPAVSDRDFRVLRPGDDALGFVKTLRPDLIQGLRDVIGKFREHRAISSKRPQLVIPSGAQKSRDPNALASRGLWVTPRDTSTALGMTKWRLPACE